MVYPGEKGRDHEGREEQEMNVTENRLPTEQMNRTPRT